MVSFIQDARYGLRCLVKNPGFTAIAIVTLALGIGASTAAFSVVNSVLFKPVGYPEPDRLVSVFTANPTLGYPRMTNSYPDFIDWRESNRSFVGMGIFASDAGSFSGGDHPERVLMVRASAGLLPVLGFGAAIGRTFGPEADLPGNDRVVLLSDSFWRRGFGADPEVVGRTILLDDVPVDVLGVLPAELERAWGQFSVWRPLSFERDTHLRGSRAFSTLGRLKPGVSLTEAQAEMETVAARLAVEYPGTNKDYTVRLVPILDVALGLEGKPALTLLTVAVGFVLLIACANVANMLLVRATDRRREQAIRSALGAGRWRSIRQTLTDSLFLALAGGGLGTLLSIWSLDILAAGLSTTMGRTQEIAVDGTALAFSLLLSVATALMFGLMPAFRSASANLTDVLKDGSRSMSAGRAGRIWRDTLVVTQIAMALVVVTCAGLMLRSFLALQAVDPGFDPRQLLTMQVKLPEQPYDSDVKRVAFIQQAVERIRGLPGVRSAAAGSSIPLIGDSADSRVTVESHDPDSSRPIFAGNVVVTPDYFATMRIPLLRGRAFTEHDNGDVDPVVIVGEKMAQRLWPGEDAVGKRLKFGRRDTDVPWYTVVGVVGNVKQVRLDRELRLETYTPHAHWAVSEMTFVTRTTGDPAEATAAVQDAIWEVDSDLVLYGVLPMEEIHSANTRARSDLAVLLAVFAVIGWVVAAAGLYSVISYNVSQRTHEIGIRVAIGARARDVLRLILTRTALLTCCGAFGGIVLALFSSGMLEAFLFGVSPADPITIAGVAVVLMVVALLASYFPARRATRTDPMEALRCE
jgi:putative ABC transport system permease protein